jgi:NADH dehydrogenase/NADH:ubiquinone oxidoreductase subunit G
MARITIDGTEVDAPEEQTILQAANDVGIKIPALCRHEALSAYGSCRLCIVEIEKGGRRRIVTSCNYPVEAGLKVFTDSARVATHRKMLIELLLARCPEVPVVRQMARRMGVETPRFPKAQHDCILCGLCVRVCDERIGASAISFVNRGVDEDVSAPFDISSESCIGCGACASVCPTGAIRMEDVQGLLKLDKFKTSKQLRQCPSCKKDYAAELHLAWIERRLGPQSMALALCTDCKRARNAESSRMVYAFQRKAPPAEGRNGIGG